MPYIKPQKGSGRGGPRRRIVSASSERTIEVTTRRRSPRYVGSIPIACLFACPVCVHVGMCCRMSPATPYPSMLLGSLAVWLCCYCCRYWLHVLALGLVVIESHFACVLCACRPSVLSHALCWFIVSFLTNSYPCLVARVGLLSWRLIPWFFSVILLRCPPVPIQMSCPLHTPLFTPMPLIWRGLRSQHNMRLPSSKVAAPVSKG